MFNQVSEAIGFRRILINKKTTAVLKYINFDFQPAKVIHLNQGIHILPNKIYQKNKGKFYKIFIFRVITSLMDF